MYPYKPTTSNLFPSTNYTSLTAVENQHAVYAEIETNHLNTDGPRTWSSPSRPSLKDETWDPCSFPSAITWLTGIRKKFKICNPITVGLYKYDDEKFTYLFFTIHVLCDNPNFCSR